MKEKKSDLEKTNTAPRDNRDKVLDLLKESGLKVTPQRLAIIDFLDGNKTHPTADEIFSAVKENHPNISFATVYNTLDALVKIGILSELTIDSQVRHFDPDISNHHHVICKSCGKIGDIFEPIAVDIQNKLDLTNDFIIENVELNFFGKCLDCTKSN